MSSATRPPTTPPEVPASGRSTPRPARSRRLVVIATVVVLLAGAGVAALAAGQDSGRPAPVAGTVVVIPAAERRSLPAFTGENVIAGKAAIDLGVLAGRGPLVLNFWATWCGPCRAEQRALEQASRQLAARGIRFVGVNIRDDRAAATAYLEEFQVSYPSIFDRPARFAARLGADAPPFPPHTMVVDADGRVAAHLYGALRGDTVDDQVAELTSVVEAALT